MEDFAFLRMLITNFEIQFIAMVTLKVKLNEQQMKLIQKLREEGKHGDSLPEVIRSVFRQWLKEKGLVDA